MNNECVSLNMTPQEADHLAYVLMAALHTTSMLASERTTATAVANELFSQLKYSHRTSSAGDRLDA